MLLLSAVEFISKSHLCFYCPLAAFHHFILSQSLLFGADQLMPNLLTSIQDILHLHKWIPWDIALQLTHSFTKLVSIAKLKPLRPAPSSWQLEQHVCVCVCMYVYVCMYTYFLYDRTSLINKSSNKHGTSWTWTHSAAIEVETMEVNSLSIVQMTCNPISAIKLSMLFVRRLENLFNKDLCFKGG